MWPYKYFSGAGSEPGTFVAAQGDNRSATEAVIVSEDKN